MAEAGVSVPITKEQLVTGVVKPHLKLLITGDFGDGKTFLGMTFPKWAYAMIEPHGILTAQSNPKLLENMVKYESFVPSQAEDIAATFTRLTNFLKTCRADAEAGTLQTVIVDNLTHLSENRWLYIQKYEEQKTAKGAVDTRAMYGALSRWLYRFTVLELLSIPAHVILTVHETEEQEEDSTGKLVKTGRVIANTLGGFRKDVAGLFSASIFLEKIKTGANQYKYQARCQEGAGRKAKNNLGLPEIVENISYQSIMDCLTKAKA